ncbi:MAG: zf-HC2 domain-containing protein [Pirellulaceae bacterium]
MTDPVKPDWQQCPAEAITRLLSENQKQSRRAAIRRVVLSSLAGFTALGGGALYWASRPPKRNKIPDGMLIQVSCKDAISLLPEFHNERLCESLNRRVRYHLEMCDHCREHYQRHYQNPVV